MVVGVLSPSIEMNGAPMSEELRRDLLELRLDLTASMPAQLTMRFSDWDGSKASHPGLQLGAALKIGLPDLDSAGSSTMVFMPKLEVTEVGVDAQADGVMELVVVAHDRSHRLGLGSSTESFEQQSPKDILTKLASAAGFLRLQSEIRASTFEAKMPYFMLADSNLAALNELVGRAGGVWWVDDSDVLHVADPGARGNPVEVTYLEDLRSCSVRVNGRYPAKVVVSGWDHTTMKRIEGQATTPSSVPGELGKKDPGFPKKTLTVTGARAATTAEADALAKVLANRSASRRLDVRGVALSRPGLGPGGRVKINGFAAATGVYDVQRVEHVFRPGDPLETRFVAGARDPVSMGGDPALGTARASSIRFDGMVIGVVTDNSDPNKLGRVKVKFPWLTESESSDWARVVGFGAGKGKKGGRGSQFVPEVNDEVLLGFEGGDMRKPVVIGTLYNDKTKPAAYEVKGGELQARVITSRLGHVFEMADGASPDKQHLLLQLADGKTRLRVGQDKVEVETPQGTPISLKSGEASLTITDKGDISIAAMNVSIAAKGDLVLDAKKELKGKGNMATLEAAVTTKVKGAMTEISASASTTVKGSIVQIN